MPRTQTHLKRTVETARKPHKGKGASVVKGQKSSVNLTQKGKMQGQDKDPMQEIGLSPRSEELKVVASRVTSNESLKMLDDDLEEGLLSDNHFELDTQVKRVAAPDDDDIDLDDIDLYKS